MKIRWLPVTVSIVPSPSDEHVLRTRQIFCSLFRNYNEYASWDSWVLSMQSINNYILTSSFIGLGLSSEGGTVASNLFITQIVCGVLAFSFAGLTNMCLSSFQRIVNHVKCIIGNYNTMITNDANDEGYIHLSQSNAIMESYTDRRLLCLLRIFSQVTTIVSVACMNVVVVSVMQLKLGAAINQNVASIVVTVIVPMLALLSILLVCSPVLIVYDANDYN